MSTAMPASCTTVASPQRALTQRRAPKWAPTTGSTVLQRKLHIARAHADEQRDIHYDVRSWDRRATLLAGLMWVGPAPAFAEVQETIASVAESAAAAASSSSTSTASTYTDPIDKFSITVPAGWEQGEGKIPGSRAGFSGATGARRTLAWFPTGGLSQGINVTVVVNNVSVEFTKLGSFGNVDTFASNLVNSLDRSFMLRAPIKPKDPIQVARLVDYRSTGDSYFVEYTVQKLPEKQRHLLSSVTLGSNGRYNRLYTVTAQCYEEDLPQFRATLDQVVKSFTANLKPSV